MWKTRILLIAIAAALILLIYNLPTVVVDDEANQANQPITDTDASAETAVLPAGEAEKRARWLENFDRTDNIEKSAIFADSLANLYAKSGVYDSAAWYFSWIADNARDDEALKKAGTMYYQAFETAPTREAAGAYGEKARDYLSRYLEANAGDADAQTKIAMTYVASDNPMKGVTMLTEIVENDPDNVSAIFNLGVLSIQSAQYERAVERFEKLVELQPNDARAHYYLGFSLMQLGREEAARQHFQKVQSLGSEDPEIATAAENYLNELK